jgi:hypothetical protein
MMVLLDAIPCIIPKPTTVMRRSESRRLLNKLNRTSPEPKMAAEIWIMVVRPRMVLRKAREMAETSAPTPEAPMRKPRVRVHFLSDEASNGRDCSERFSGG